MLGDGAAGVARQVLHPTGRPARQAQRVVSVEGPCDHARPHVETCHQPTADQMRVLFDDALDRAAVGAHDAARLAPGFAVTAQAIFGIAAGARLEAVRPDVDVGDQGLAVRPPAAAGTHQPALARMGQGDGRAPGLAVVADAVGDPGVGRILVPDRALPLGVEPTLEGHQHHAVAEPVGSLARREDGEGLRARRRLQPQIGRPRLKQAGRRAIRRIGRSGGDQADRRQTDQQGQPPAAPH